MCGACRLPLRFSVGFLAGVLMLKMTHFSLKMALLVALASFKRASDVHAFSINSVYMDLYTRPVEGCIETLLRIHG